MISVKWTNTLNGVRYVVSMDGKDQPTLYKRLQDAVQVADRLRRIAAATTAQSRATQQEQ